MLPDSLAKLYEERRNFVIYSDIIMVIGLRLKVIIADKKVSIR